MWGVFRLKCSVVSKAGNRTLKTEHRKLKTAWDSYFIMLKHNLQDAEALVMKLLAIPGPSGEEEAVSQQIAALLRAAGRRTKTSRSTRPIAAVPARARSAT